MSLDLTRPLDANSRVNERRSEQMPAWARALFILGTLAPIWRLAHLIFKYAIPVPFMDEWAVARLMIHAHGHVLTFDDLWTQHNEHRMLFPNLVYLGLAHWGGWSVRRECWASLIVTLGTFGLIADLARRLVALRLVYPLCFVLSWLVFSPMQWENFIIGFNLQFTLAILAFFWCIWSLTVWRGRGRGLAFGILGAALSSFSMAGGLMTWLVGLGYLLLASPTVLQETKQPRWTRVHQVVWLVAAAACIGAFMHGSNFGADGVGHGYWRRHPSVLANYIAFYLGSPVLFIRRWLTSLVGVVGMAAYGCFGLTWLRLRRAASDDDAADAMLAWLMIGMFGLLSAITTGIGRCSFSAVQGGSSRYISISNTLWIGVIGAGTVLYHRARAMARMSALPRYAFAAACLAAAFVFWHWSIATAYVQVAETTRICRRGVANLPNYKTAPDAVLSLLYPDPAALRQTCAALERAHLWPLGRE